MLATCCSIAPSFCRKVIWQFAWIFAQASSNPFFTACQNGLEAEEWWVKTMLSCSARAGAPQASPSASRPAPIMCLCIGSSFPPVCRLLSRPAAYSVLEMRDATAKC
jgi:hypothetical protein